MKMNVPFLLSKDAWEVERSKARFKFVLAGRGWGKSEFGVRSAIIRALSKPNQKIWYFAPTFGQVKDITLDKFKNLLPIDSMFKISSPITITFPNRSTISLRSAEKFDRIRGSSLNYMIWDEFRDFKQGFEMSAIPCLRTVKDNLLVITTPENYRGYDFYLDGKQKKNDWESWSFTSLDSPFVDKKAVEIAMGNLSEQDFKQEYLGEWVSSKGLVAYCFDRDKHIADDIVYDENLPLYISNDFNISPMVSSIYQPHGAGDKELWCIDEVVSNDISTFEHTDKVVAKYGKHKQDIHLFGDATGRGRQRTGVSDWEAVEQTFFGAGISPIMRVATSNPRVAERIKIMNGFLQPYSGEPRLFFNPQCEKTIKDLSAVSRDANGGIDKKCERLGMGHLLDTVGYICCEISNSFI